MAKKKTPAPAGYDEDIAAQLWQQVVSKVQAEIKRQGLTQEQIAADTGISQRTVSLFVVKGEIGSKRLLMLADYLGFTWAWEPKARPASKASPKKKRPARKKAKSKR